MKKDCIQFISKYVASAYLVSTEALDFSGNNAFDVNY